MKNILLSFWLLFFSFNIAAQSVEDTVSDSVHLQHEVYHNHVAVFLGVTTFDRNGNSHFSLGADYIHRWDPNNPWAFGLIGEIIFADHTEYLLALPVYFHVASQWWVRAAPGVEFIQEEEHHGEEHTYKTQTEFLLRIGTGYAFHIGRLVLTPSVDFDFVRNNDALVWGLNFGYSF